MNNMNTKMMGTKMGGTSNFDFTSTCPGCKKDFSGGYGDCSNYYSWSLEGHTDTANGYGLSIKCEESGKTYAGGYDMFGDGNHIELHEMKSLNLFN